MKHLRLLVLVSVLMTTVVACGNNPGASEFEIEVPEDNQQGQGGDGKQDDEMITPDDDQMQKAYNAFVAKGVPAVALTRAFDFYVGNLKEDSGLEDTSCLIKPMSETGAIPVNSNRYDPTTISMLREGIRNKRYIMIVDFTKSNTANRGYLLDMQPDVSGEYHMYRMQISHGYGSKAVNGIPQIFTNKSGHGTTVSGFHVTASKTYNYYGNISSGTYSSIGLRLYGLESSNNTAESTSKVSHGAPYNTDSRAGNSAGCPAMTQENAHKWLPKLTGGVLWYHHTKLNNSINHHEPSC